MEQKNGLNAVPSSNRVHISFFGRTNAGKSSLINAVTKQEISLVSELKGTTTDPVSKSMELLPLGPVVLTDTPGLDDDSIIGKQRVKRAKQILSKTDIAVLVVDMTIFSGKESSLEPVGINESEGLSRYDREMLQIFQEKNLPFVLVLNKAEKFSHNQREKIVKLLADTEHIDRKNIICVSAEFEEKITELKELLGHIILDDRETDIIISDKINPGDTVVLVIPIDSAAPKGRLILPQQQTIRDILEAGALAYAVRETELPQAFQSLSDKPKVVITDSQVFHRVKEDVPEDVYLTSFSILFARKKGNLILAAKNAAVLSDLPSGSRILICEACTHHRQCDDIGTVKLPIWIREFTGKEFQFSFTSGGYFPEDISGYDLIVHCGGCMINRREMQSRLEKAQAAGVPITNYGVLIAYMQGILERCMEIFNND